MRAVLQRVSEASVEINNKIAGRINSGLMVLLGIETTDTEEDISWLSQKIVNMRIFADDDGLMNKSVTEINGEILLISQFTLFADTKKGNRPSYLNAARPEYAIPVYERFILVLEELLKRKIQTGSFGADMKVSLINDGPVTIIIDSKNKF